MDHQLRKKLLSLLVLFSYFTSSCKTLAPQRSELKKIIGNDDRAQLESPYGISPVGILYRDDNWRGEKICSATLTSPTMIVTAAHCLEDLVQVNADRSVNLKQGIEVVFGRNIKAEVLRVSEIFEDLDLVFLELRKPIETFDVRVPEIDSYDPSAALSMTTAPELTRVYKKIDPTAKPVDPSKAVIELGAEILENPQNPTAQSGWRNVWQLYTQDSKSHGADDLGFLTYDLDTEPGYSGSPIFQNGNLVGVHLGYDPKSKLNIGISIVEIYSSYNAAREKRVSDITAEGGISIKKIKDWGKKLSKEPFKTLTGTLADLDPTNPGGSLHPSADELTRALKEIDVTSRHSQFRQMLGRIDPNHKIGKYLDDHKGELIIVAALALSAYGGYILIANGYAGGVIGVAYASPTTGATTFVPLVTFSATGAGAAAGTVGGVAAAGAVGVMDGESNDGITVVVTSPGAGRKPTPAANVSESSGTSVARTGGKKKTSSGKVINSQASAEDIMVRIAALTQVDAALIKDHVDPNLLLKLESMIDKKEMDPELLKELRIALDDLAKALRPQHPALATDLDDIADSYAMSNEYKLGSPTLSETRKLNIEQQRDLIAIQIEGAKKFVNERLEDDDRKAARLAALNFMATSGLSMLKLYQSYSSGQDRLAYYTKLSLDWTLRFADFSADFFLIPTLMKYTAVPQPYTDTEGNEINPSEAIGIGIDLVSIFLPKWLRKVKGAKASEVLSDASKNLDKSTPAGQLLSDSLKAGSDEAGKFGFKTFRDYQAAKKIFGDDETSIHVFSKAVAESVPFEKNLGGGLQQYQIQAGGFTRAVDDWSSYPFVKILNDSPDLKIGQLENGTNIIVRRESSSNPPIPTLEFQRLKPSGAREPVVKIRYP